MENRIAANVARVGRALRCAPPFLIVLFSISMPGSAPAAEENASRSREPIQRQLDDLKQGQQRILQELEAIKKLLQERPPGSTAAPPKTISINVHGEPFRGDRAARVAIMEYSDFECSYCAKYVHDVFPTIEKDYIKTGKVKYFFRDLPAPEHTNAMAAAQAARCAGDQGAFWQMHDLLFAAQGALSQSNFTANAQALGLDIKKFSECVSSGIYSGSIRLSAAGAKALGVYGTPAFVLGTLSEDGDVLRVTKVLVGGESDAELRPALNELIASRTNAVSRTAQ